MKRIWIVTTLMMATIITMSQTSWYPQNSGTNTVLFDVHFVNQLEGWLCGNTGLVMKTVDGGANWVELDAPPNNTYYNVHFADSQNGWVTGYGGKIIHTTDGGESWEDQEAGTNTYLYDVFFIDDNTGWIVGGDNGTFPSFNSYRLILYTSNGGATWTKQVEETNESVLRSVHFSDADNGYAVGESGIVLRTVNGGTTWNVVMEEQPYHMTGVSTVNALTAFVTGEYLGLPHVPVIFKTIDGGTTWTSDTFEEGVNLINIFFPDENHGWAVGGSNGVSIILSTSDGGESWIYDQTATEDYLFNVFFTDAETGWAVGMNGTVTSTLLLTGIEDAVSEDSFHIYPNPATEEVNLAMNVIESTPVIISLVNFLGQVVYRHEGQLTPGKSIHTINTEIFPTGYYLTVIENGSDQITQKLIIR